jgi:hypothetical protein
MKLFAAIGFALAGWGALLLLTLASARFARGLRLAWRGFFDAALGRAPSTKRRNA